VVRLVLRYVTRGVPPLVHATGAGAASRQAIGTPVFCGMIGSTCLGLSFTPVPYVVITVIVERIRKPKKLAAEDVVVELLSPVLSVTS
jgi:HAE1 family hydrophobic/amphiphilic exporter-1